MDEDIQSQLEREKELLQELKKFVIMIRKQKMFPEKLKTYRKKFYSKYDIC